MNAVLAVPFELRLALLFLLGAVLGGQLNRAVYRLAWNRRSISPWSPPPEGVARRSWLACVPIFGWLAMRRESEVHGHGFWIRPMFIELGAAVGLAALYAWEVRGGLLPITHRALAALPLNNPLSLARLVHEQFLAHAVLLALLAVGTFIDFDEQTIPDAVTVPGTVLGLLFAALLPATRLPVLEAPGGSPRISPLLLHSPAPNDAWPAWLDGPAGLAIGLACVVAACLAILPWLWTTRRGLRKAFAYLVASVARDRGSKYIGLLAMGAIAGVTATWLWGRGEGDASWHALLSALVGMVFGGGLIWLVRIFASLALQREAMGFGDVTLMAMIGAFLGWQPALLVFFLAPFAALIIAVLQKLLSGSSVIAFGPYLSLAAVYLIVDWNRVWNLHAADVFTLGWRIPAITAAGLLLMGGILYAWRLFRDSLAKSVR